MGRNDGNSGYPARRRGTSRSALPARVYTPEVRSPGLQRRARILGLARQIERSSFSLLSDAIGPRFSAYHGGVAMPRFMLASPYDPKSRLRERGGSAESRKAILKSVADLPTIDQARAFKNLLVKVVGLEYAPLSKGDIGVELVVEDRSSDFYKGGSVLKGERAALSAFARIDNTENGAIQDQVYAHLGQALGIKLGYIGDVKPDEQIPKGIVRLPGMPNSIYLTPIDVVRGKR